MTDYQLKNIENCRKFFEIADRIDKMTRLVYSEDGERLNKDLSDKIANLLLEWKGYTEVCSELGISSSTFYRYTNPEYREKCKERHRKYYRKRLREDPEYREKQREYHRKKWREDPEYREKQREYQREYHKKKWREDPKYREKKREYQRKREKEPNLFAVLLDCVFDTKQNPEEELTFDEIKGRAEKIFELYGRRVTQRRIEKKVNELVKLGIYEKVGEKYKPGMPRLMGSLF